MKKKRTLITVGAMILLLSVVTYAYYTAGISNDNAQIAELSTGTMSLSFDDGDNGVAAVLNFGDTITKKFTLANTGSLDASASISWFNLVNTYLAGSLMYELEYSETLDGEYKPIVSNLMVPTSEEPITTPLVTQVTVPVGKVYYYNLNITLINSEVIDQTSDINASFHTQFTIKDASSLSASEQTLANLGLVVSNGTPNFSQADGTTYKDNGFSNKEKTYNVSSSSVNDTIYYSETYTFDEITKLYSLVNPKSGKYKDVVSSLKNVYVTKLGVYWSKDTQDQSELYKIKSANYDSSTNTGSWNYLEPNELIALPDYSTTGIYSMDDDYGVSYYFRGAVENNYVKFGKWHSNISKFYYPIGYATPDTEIFDTLEECEEYYGKCIEFNPAGKDMYWRIIRINGDGSLRIAYDGLKAYKNGEETIYDFDRFITNSSYSDVYNNTRLGYMHGLDLNASSYSCYVDGEIYEGVASREDCLMSGLGTCTFNDGMEDVTWETNQYECEEALLGTFSNPTITAEWISNDINKNRCLKLIDEVVTDVFDTYQTKTNCENAGGKWTTNDYETTHSNIKDSIIKTVIDKWYKNNIYDNGFYTAVSDTLFCNDRTTKGGGIGNDTVTYNVFTRLTNMNPQLICPQKNDAFTVNDTKKGNGDLTYPVALLNADEMFLAGAITNQNNKMFYLNKSIWYWSMSPAYNNGGVETYALGIDTQGMLSAFNDPAGLTGAGGVMPVINLKPEYVASMIGDGTIGNEFRVN